MSPNFVNLSKRIIIQDSITKMDELGNEFQDWYDYMEIWGYIESIKAIVKNSKYKVDKEVTHRITIRHNPHLSNQMRIKFENRIFSIQGMQDREQDTKFQIIHAIEKV